MCFRKHQCLAPQIPTDIIWNQTWFGQIKAIATAAPPSNVHEIRKFLGLCNFLHTHVRNFAQISGHLKALTRKDSEWKKGPLLPNELQAFRELQTCLCSEPIVNYPHKTGRMHPSLMPLSEMMHIPEA
jgi:hypothetical protein